jgi:prepilin-type N-terminal cleavage/methylation domain-containing protein
MKKRNQSRNLGFTLIELIIAIVIVGILASAGIVTYRSTVRQSMMAEGVALLSAAAAAEKIWKADHGTFTGNTTDINADQYGETNRYFRTVTISNASATTFTLSTTMTTDGGGLTVNYAFDANGNPPVLITGFDGTQEILRQ